MASRIVSGAGWVYFIVDLTVLQDAVHHVHRHALRQQQRCAGMPKRDAVARGTLRASAFVRRAEIDPKPVARHCVSGFCVCEGACGRCGAIVVLLFW